MVATSHFQSRTFSVLLSLLFSGVTTTVMATKARSTYYHADLGQYGAFEMEISADDSSMRWKTSLTNIDRLQQQLGLDSDQMITALNYHLHQQWTNANADYSIGADACGAAITGGHYDPFFGCGPATGVPVDHCAFIGKNTSSYTCSPQVYESGAYSKCEVGDFSGKYGPIPVVVNDDGTAIASSTVSFDPLPALDSHYQDDRIPSAADRFASIIFHNGGPRVLCGKINLGKLPDDIDFQTSAHVTPPTPPISASTPRRGRLLHDATLISMTMVLTIMSLLSIMC